MLITLTWIVFGFATASLGLFLVNSLFFRPPRVSIDAADSPKVSVLIPARNEVANIASVIAGVLANHSVELEVIVLDDNSEDDTASMVETLGQQDPRIRLVKGTPLPDGWCGKQYACHQLAEAAAHDLLLFIDADVRLERHAIATAVAGMRYRQADLYSGFPRLSAQTLGEGLLLPMIYLVLLTYLPMFFMRWTRMKAAAAGCGQFFLTTRSAYDQSGGHAAIRSSLHDGVTLPRAYREAGLRTDLFDASSLATCRMYEGFAQSQQGLRKNAHEGIATPTRIGPFSVLLIMGYVAPTVFLITNAIAAVSNRPHALAIAAVAVCAASIPRWILAARYDRQWLAAAMLPISVIMFLSIQWEALFAHRRGETSTWRGRTY